MEEEINDPQKGGCYLERAKRLFLGAGAFLPTTFFTLSKVAVRDRVIESTTYRLYCYLLILKDL